MVRVIHLIYLCINSSRESKLQTATFTGNKRFFFFKSSHRRRTYAKFAVSGIYLTWSSESCAFPLYGYQSLRRCRVITASRVALAVSQVAASCFCPVARIEFVNPGFASFPFSAVLHLGSPLALYLLCISISTYPPFPSHSSFARTANNVRSSLGRAWQRANAA